MEGERSKQGSFAFSLWPDFGTGEICWIYWTMLNRFKFLAEIRKFNYDSLFCPVTQTQRHVRTYVYTAGNGPSDRSRDKENELNGSGCERKRTKWTESEFKGVLHLL